MALAWLADRPAVTSVILGARTVEQLDDNLGAADLHLSAKETRPPRRGQRPVVADYPYGEPGVTSATAGFPLPGPPRPLR